jgi:hypothetical protein
MSLGKLTLQTVLDNGRRMGAAIEGIRIQNVKIAWPKDDDPEALAAHLEFRRFAMRQLDDDQVKSGIANVVNYGGPAHIEAAKQLPRIALTQNQKMAALAYKYYQHGEWRPKAGDFYTTARADLELYRVVKIENEIVYTEYCHLPGVLSEWPQDGFTTEGFGPRRVYVPEHCFNII